LTQRRAPGRSDAIGGLLVHTMLDAAFAKQRSTHTEQSDGDDYRDRPPNPVDSVRLGHAEQTSDPVSEQCATDTSQPVAPPRHSGLSTPQQRGNDRQYRACNEYSPETHVDSSPLSVGMVPTVRGYRYRVRSAQDAALSTAARQSKEDTCSLH